MVSTSLESVLDLKCFGNKFKKVVLSNHESEAFEKTKKWVRHGLIGIVAININYFWSLAKFKHVSCH